MLARMSHSLEGMPSIHEAQKLLKSQVELEAALGGAKRSSGLRREPWSPWI